jgi:hypothetical protein
VTLDPGQPLYTARVGWALAFAASIHAAQTRKGKPEPYLSHLLAVGALVTHYGGTEDQIIGGLLHDAAEDCGGSARLAEIATLFGPEVATIVEDCSDSLTASPEEKAPWHERKVEHLAHLRECLTTPTALVAAADKIANLADIVEDLESHVAEGGGDADSVLSLFKGGPVGSRAYYSAMHALLAPHVPPAAARRLEELVVRLGAEVLPAGVDPVEWFAAR